MTGTGAAMTWLEAVPPLVIITACIAGVGALPSAVHRGFNGGKNKKVQRDHFALLMERRDARIDAEAASAASASK